MPRDEFEEKSHYSYDEMMNRLKESRSGGHGSRGKRRRRSEQAPTGKSTKFKIIAILAAFLVIVALAVPVVIFMMSQGQYTTDAFRKSVNDRVSALTGKTSDFGPFRMQGKSLFSDRLEISDDSRSGWLHQARLVGLRADFETSLHKGTEWPVKKLAINSAQVVLGYPSGQPQQLAPPSGGQLSKPFVGLDPNPSAIVVRDLYVRELDLAWGPKGDYDTLRGAKLQAQIAGGSATWLLSDGKLKFGQIPALTVANLSGDYSHNKVSIQRGVIGYNKIEMGTISGEILLASPASANLQFSLDNIKLETWLDLHHRENGKASKGLLSDTVENTPWTDRIASARLFVQGEYASSLEQDAPAPTISGTFTLNGAVFSNWHLFYSIGLAFDESRLNSLAFEPIQGKFRSQGGILEISDLNAEAKGLIKIRGGFTITSDPKQPTEIPAITGALEIGLPAVDLDGFDGGYPKFF
ncbi:MAG: hypothetical protein KDN22_32385, partial [Verrucomicrobiae bacterium]|nr:hypothetical protein [Verrucomicrobiae bacterium]